MLVVGRKGGGEEDQEEDQEEEAAQAQSKCFRAYNLPDMLLKHEDNVWGNVLGFIKYKKKKHRQMAY